jgi:ATP-dependent Clp protease adaptor protein ClpS
MAAKEEIKVGTEIDELLNEALENSKLFNLILFNDDHHDMVEVMVQLIRAIRCSKQKALNLMMKAHTQGQSIVLTGSRKEVVKAGNILEEIDLMIDITEF